MHYPQNVGYRRMNLVVVNLYVAYVHALASDRQSATVLNRIKYKPTTCITMSWYSHYQFVTHQFCALFEDCAIL